MCKINNAFAGQVVNIEQILSSPGYQQINCKNPRLSAKKKVAYVVERIAALTNLDDVQVQRMLYRKYADYEYGNNIGALREILGPILNAR